MTVYSDEAELRTLSDSYPNKRMFKDDGNGMSWTTLDVPRRVICFIRVIICGELKSTLWRMNRYVM